MKDFTKLNIFLLFLFINSIQALKRESKYGPIDRGQNLNITTEIKFRNAQRRKHGNMNTLINNSRSRFRNNYNSTYNNYNKRNKKCSLKVLGMTLLSIWIIFVVLYFLVNRRKKTFTVMVRGRNNNVSNYMNI